jgi:hypothetical protein
LHQALQQLQSNEFIKDLSWFHAILPTTDWLTRQHLLKRRNYPPEDLARIATLPFFFNKKSEKFLQHIFSSHLYRFHITLFKQTLYRILDKFVGQTKAFKFDTASRKP